MTKMNPLTHALALLNPNARLFEPREQYDACIVAIGRNHPRDRWKNLRVESEAPFVAIYDVDALVRVLVGDSDEDDAYEQAADHVAYNMVGMWLDGGTPIVVAWNEGEDD